MGLPEVNRARIEKLNQEVRELESEVDALKGEVEELDPIVTDDSFPNIVPPVPADVHASALFRSIQLTWEFIPDSYIATYEVYASQEENFTPLPNHLIWKGKSGGYLHPASTGETWYFRVRAVNTHGTASDFSEQVSATTVDISGLEIDETWKIDFLEEANMYSDEIKNEMLAELATKIDANVFYDNLLLKANVSDMEDGFSQVNAELLRLDNAINLRVTKTQYDADINDEENGLIARMNNAEGQLTVLNNEISLRVTEEELDIRMGDVVHRLDLHEAELVTLSDEIALRVTHTEFDALNTRLTEAEGEISTLAGQVELRATKSELDAVDERLSTAEAKLIVQADQISQRVEKNGIIASINLSPETLKINVAKMEINGDLEVVGGLVKLKNLVVDSAHIKDGAIVKRMFAENAIVDSINAGTALIDFAKIGNVQITNAHISGKIDANKINATTLSAISSNIGTVTAGTIKGLTIEGGTINGTSGIFRGSLITQDPSDNSEYPSQTIINYSTFFRQVHDYENEYFTNVTIGSHIDMSKFDYSGLFGPKPNRYLSGNFSIYEKGITFGVRSVSPSGWRSVIINLDGIYYSNPNNSNEILFRDTDIAFSTNVSVVGDITASGRIVLPQNKYLGSGGGLDAQNSDIINVNSLHFADPGGSEGIFWSDGNGWGIVEAPDDLSNGSGQLQFYTGYPNNRVRRMTLSTAGNLFLTGTRIEGGTNMVYGASGGYIVLRAGAGGSYAYIQTDVEARVTRVAQGSNYVAIRASSFPTASSILYKTNIEPLSEEEAMFLLDNADVFTYHLKSNVENGVYDKPKIGMISEMVPQKLRDEDGVDPYSIVATLWKVVQVQQRKIEELLSRVSTLEEVV